MAPDFSFSDMTTTDRLEWSTEAPQWRIADSGLNLEGKCSHAGCKAAGLRVVLRVGMVTNFELSSGRYDHVCPVCEHEVDADTVTTLAVARCVWAWEGRVRLPGGGTEKKSGAGTADDAYHVFRDDVNNHSVNWAYMKLTTSPLPAECASG
jgi:hypothetical protein